MSSIDTTTAARGRTMPVARGGILAGTGARVIAGAAVLAVVAGAIVVTRAGSGNAPVAPRTAPVTRGAVTQVVQVSGSITPVAQTRVSFQSGGRLAAVLVSVGQTVTAGQPLARLDTSDLQIALSQAQASLASAQANYGKVAAGATPQDIAVAKQAVDNAQKSLAGAQRSAASSLTTSQQAFSTLKTSYASAQSGFQLLAGAVPADVGTYSTSLDSTRLILATALTDLTTESTADITSAKNSIGQADTAMANAQTVSGGQLASALTQWTSARDNVISAWMQFDGAVQRGTDTSSVVSRYQSAQLTYASATSRLQAAIGSVSSSLTSAQSAASAAQNALNSSTSQIDPGLDKSRSDLLGFQAAIAGETQLASSINNELTQMATSLATITAAVGGSYVAAQQAVSSTQTQNANSVQNAQSALASAVASLNNTAAPPQSYDVAAAYASVLAARAGVDKATNDLANATLTAPSAGIVSSIAYQPGEFVPAGSTANPFIVLADISTVVLYGTVGEADVAKLKLGQVATVTVDALGSAPQLTGRVTSIDPVATIQQGVPVYGVNVTIDLPDQAMRSGMTGTANVIIASKQGVLTVPNLAIKSQNGRRFVQVLRDGKVENANVTFGISNDTVTEVTSGLKEGDQVVLPTLGGTTGTPQLRRGGGPGGGRVFGGGPGG